MSIPNGYIVDGLIFWGCSLSSQTILSKGFYVEAESMRSLSTSELNALHEQLNLMLLAFDPTYSLQIQWFVDSDHDAVLEHYSQQTHTRSQNSWTKMIREDLYADFQGRKQIQQLRKEKLALFITKRCSTVPKGLKNTQGQLEAIVSAVHKELTQTVLALSAGLSYVRLVPMADADYYRVFTRFFNPSISACPLNLEGFDADESIIENCMHSDGVTTHYNGQVVFKMDDHYHCVLVLTKWPKQTYPGVIEHLTQALSQDYTITQSIYFQDPNSEIEREEKELQDLKKYARNNDKASMLASIEKKQEKIEALTQGNTKPFKVMTVIRVWDRDLDELYRKTIALKTAINGMGGAHAHQANFPAQAISLFFETFPAWTGGDRRAWDLYAENHFLADLMPISSTFCGAPEPEALYLGNAQNLVGIQCFRSGTPQHAVLLGMTGAGKSVAMFDLLSQTECYYDFTAIIEEGLSYATYTRLMGSEPIIIHPDSAITINYLDAHGLPLTQEHISMAACTCLKMIGYSQDEDKNNKRLAIFTEYINELYWLFFEQWSTQCRTRYKDFRRFALAVYMLFKQETAKMTLLEACLQIKGMQTNNPEAYTRLLEGQAEDALQRFDKDPETHLVMRNLLYTFFGPEDFPTHSHLVELMRNRSFDHHNAEEISHISTLLGNWTRTGGAYGKLFDGPSNLRIDDSIAHFELGYIPESASAMKELAGFIISTWVRQHILKMPRAKRKRIIFEEVSRFLNIQGGDKILAEAYAQLRKFGCWVCCVTQQYSQLKSSPLRPVIFGNSKLFFLMKQNDIRDLEDIAEDIGLPERAVSEIMKYELPEHQIGYNKASYMMVYALGGKTNSCGTAKIVASKEMLYAASSNGEVFDQRMQQLAKYDNILEGIIHESQSKVAC